MAIGKDGEMREHQEEDVPYVVIERTGSRLMPFLWGAVLGAAAALLLAPKSGAETQAELKERARRLRERAERKAGELQEAFQDAWSEGREHVEEKFEGAKRAVAEGRVRAQQAFDAGRKAAQAARGELEEQISLARRKKDDDSAES